jgi:putative peptide maturation system protein
MSAEGAAVQQMETAWLSNIALSVNGETISLADVITHAKWKDQLSFYQAATDAALIRQAAQTLGLTVSTDELQQAADSFRYVHRLTDPAAAKAWLAARHLTQRDWERLLEVETLTGKLREIVTAHQIEPYFAEHRLSFDVAVISRLVVASEETARELRIQIVEEGAYFYALARRYSIDTATRPAGGYVGPVGRAELTAAAEAAVFNANVGQVVGPFKTSQGWALLRVEALHPATLDHATCHKIRNRLFEEWLQNTRTNAHLQMHLLT